jgi:hypothetical protein
VRRPLPLGLPLCLRQRDCLLGYPSSERPKRILCVKRDERRSRDGGRATGRKLSTAKHRGPKMYVRTMPASGLTGSQTIPRTRETWNALVRELWYWLEQQRFRPHEATRLATRRRRLIALFSSLAPWDASELYARLFLLPADPLGELFRRRLATPTRNTLRRILRGRLRERI